MEAILPSCSRVRISSDETERIFAESLRREGNRLRRFNVLPCSFLLKFDVSGHEDLRQDERVMQLFGLVNTLLINDPETSRRNLTIQRYSVIPLSTNSGLIGWVPNCDTLHTLIKEHRERKKIMLNLEHRIILRMSPQYDHLPLAQKVEVFEHCIGMGSSHDLANLLWLKSPTSEEWFERRTNYTRSLAVMSMVGYILGEFLSGRLLHEIPSFGRCFFQRSAEVSMNYAWTNVPRLA